MCAFPPVQSMFKYYVCIRCVVKSFQRLSQLVNAQAQAKNKQQKKANYKESLKTNKQTRYLDED